MASDGLSIGERNIVGDALQSRPSEGYAPPVMVLVAVFIRVPVIDSCIMYHVIDDQDWRVGNMSRVVDTQDAWVVRYPTFPAY